MKPYRRVFEDLLGQLLVVGLIPAAIALAITLKPAPESAQAAQALTHHEAHRANCRICALIGQIPDEGRPEAEPGNVDETEGMDDPGVAVEVPLAASPAGALLQDRDTAATADYASRLASDSGFDSPRRLRPPILKPTSNHDRNVEF